jgi:hypothetical protein
MARQRYLTETDILTYNAVSQSEYPLPQLPQGWPPGEFGF